MLKTISKLFLQLSPSSSSCKLDDRLGSACPAFGFSSIPNTQSTVPDNKDGGDSEVGGEYARIDGVYCFWDMKIEYEKQKC